jgi:arylsulfatase A-like enzyme
MVDRPNLVLIHCHDLGRYLGCYGADVDTPRIDAMAAEGTLFENHFATAPQCSPSRASLLTGRHPHEHGLLGLAHDAWELHDDERTLPEYLSAAGYAAHQFGLQHVTEHPDRLGYDDRHAERDLTPATPPTVHEDSRARDVAERFASWLDAVERDAPFFAAVGFFELHRMENDDGAFVFADDRYESTDPEAVEPLPYLPDEPGIRRDLADAHGMVRAIDDGVGRVLDALAAAGIAEETLVVFTTEHGLAMPRAKGTAYDPGIEAALVMRWPDSIEPGQRRTELVSNVDVLPTLLDLLGQGIPDRITGRSVRPALAGEGKTMREALFAEMTWHDAYNPIRAIRTDRYKYVRNFWSLPTVYLPNDVRHSPAGDAVGRDLDRPTRAYEELYDLAADPHERTNVVDEPEHADAAADLRERLHDWMSETDDPLLDGPVPPGEFDAIMAWPPE